VTASSKQWLYLLAPGLIHTGKGIGVLFLELLPKSQVTSIRVFPKRMLKFFHIIFIFKSAKLQTQLIEAVLDLWKCEAVLLHMK
jgi:hypothetical protein